jgi:ribosome-associated toxin RatA of RatAB toxin-antitoxin module
MKTVHKSVLIWYSAEEMFALVTDVAKYCEFLPWCDHSRVVALEPDGMKAEMGLAFSGIHQTFTTRNYHVPGREVRIKLVDGPFSNLDGTWKFAPLGGGRPARLQGDAGDAVRLQEHGPVGRDRPRVRQDRGQPDRRLRQAGRTGLRLIPCPA